MYQFSKKIKPRKNNIKKHQKRVFNDPKSISDFFFFFSFSTYSSAWPCRFAAGKKKEAHMSESIFHSSCLLLGLKSGVLPNLLKSSICEHSIFCLLPFSWYLSEELMPYSGIRASRMKSITTKMLWGFTLVPRNLKITTFWNSEADP